MEKNKLTKAEQIFGSKVKGGVNRQIINERPKGMTYIAYRAARREQNEVIKNCLRG